MMSWTRNVIHDGVEKEYISKLDLAAERLAEKMKTLPAEDALMKHLEAEAVEFLRSRGFDISTFAGCKAALAWLESAKVEEAFVDGGKIESSADWYIGEARLEGMKRIVENRIQKDFKERRK